MFDRRIAESIENIPLPEDAERWNRAMRGAFKKGMTAYLTGQSDTACPYRDRRNFDGRLTWSRAFRKAWQDGYQYAKDFRV